MEEVILIPSFEPTDTLVSLVQNLGRLDINIIVVDDGSGSGYDQIFNSLNNYAHVIRYQKNRGKGHALKVGLDYIKNHFYEPVIVTMDGDGQHSVDDALALMDAAENDPNTFYLGSRRLPKDAPLRSRFGNGVTRFVYARIAGLKIYDTQTGLRAFAYPWLTLLLETEGERYEYEMNILLAIAKKKLPVKEIPIQTIYLDEKNSVSHFDTIKDSIRIYSQILKFAMSSFTGFLIDYVMYTLLVTLLGATTGGILVANLGARAVSATANFTINRKLVFHSKGNLIKEIFKYAALALFIIVVNTLILEGLARIGVNVYLAKVIVELIMFFISYTVQHTLIFRKEEKKECQESIYSL